MYISNSTPVYADRIWYLKSPPDVPGEPDPLCIRRMGRFQGKGAFRRGYVPHHTFCHIIVDGCAEVTTGGDPVRCGPGDVIFFLRDQASSYAEVEPTLFIFFDFGGAGVEDVLRPLGIVPGRQVVRGTFHHLTRSICEEVEALYRDDSAPYLYPTALVWRFLGMLSRELNTGERPAADVAEQCRAILLQEFATPITIQGVAKRLNVSRTTLFRVFRSRFGVSPKVFLDRERMKRAAWLLRTTSLSVSEVGYGCGFESLQHFSRMFVKHHGLSPRAWRVNGSGGSDIPRA